MSAPGTVLLWGIETDPPIQAVLAALRRLGADTLLVDERAYHAVDLRLSVERSVTGTLRVGGRTLPLGEICGCYVRPQDFRRQPPLRGRDAADPAWRHAAQVEDRLLAWVDVAPALVLNRPADMSSNGSKPFQCELIRAAGFATPATLLTTDADAVAEFWGRHGDVVYKSISGVRSIVRRLDAALHSARLANVAHCPTQFQAYVPGNDWRVHVVGERIFACEIASPADDYRYAAQQRLPLEITARPLPDDVAQRCLALAALCRLPLAGIDLRLTPEGEWFGFEVNPSPGFTYYQDATGEPIDVAVAELLSGRATAQPTAPRRAAAGRR